MLVKETALYDPKHTHRMGQPGVLCHEPAAVEGAERRTLYKGRFLVRLSCFAGT